MEGQQAAGGASSHQRERRTGGDARSTAEAVQAQKVENEAKRVLEGRAGGLAPTMTSGGQKGRAGVRERVQEIN